MAKFTFNPDGTDYSAEYLEINTPEQLRYRIAVTDDRIKNKYPNNYYFIFRNEGKLEFEFQPQGISDTSLLTALVRGIEKVRKNKAEVIQ